MIQFLIPALIIILFGGTIAFNLDRIKSMLYGTSLAIVGERKTGKSTIHKFLEEGVIYDEYKPGHEVRRVKRGRLKTADLNIKISAGQDVTGDIRRTFWKDLIEKSDYTIYVFRIDWILNKKQDYQKRIMDDLKHISKTVISKKAKKSKFRACLVGTHFDLVNATTEEKLKIESQFKNHEFFKQGLLYMGGASTASILLGSLATSDDASLLMARVLKSLTEQ